MTRDWIILVADDELDNLNVIVEYMELQGMTVYTAANGKQVLELLTGIRPDCILLDIAMPGMSGWETLTQIRMDPEISDVPVIALTAQVMNTSKADVLSYGFDGYIAKPFDLVKVMKEVQYWLERGAAV